MPTIPIPTTISPQQGGTSSIGGPPVQPVGHNSTPTIPESSPSTPLKATSIGEGTSTRCQHYWRRWYEFHWWTVQPAGHNNTPTIPELSPILPTQSSPIGEGTSSLSNTIGQGESSNNRRQRTLNLVTLTPEGLEPSKECSNAISETFKNQVDADGINWKGVSEETKDFYFGEFKKVYYWDSSIHETAIKKQWKSKAAKRYRDFISKIKKKGIKPDYVPDNVWESWMRLWADPKCVEKSEINAKNHCGGGEVAAGTHTGGSISIGEHRKKLAVEKGRDPTPSEMHLHVHTHGHDGESFVDEHARAVHERYLEILREKSQSQSDIDQCEAYYLAVGGEKKRRIYGLGSEAKSYYGPNLRVSCGSDASSSVPPSVSQSAPRENLEELVMRLIPILTDHMLPIFIEQARGVISTPSHQPNTPNDNSSAVTSIVPPPTTANVDEVDPSLSDDDRSLSPMH
ncbi:uncharacterized protein LOC132066403 [Lycium ferocissimum]|uniref:uncharacterized protein LOC132066403 n=1 Tax=Lycium ferocissimum TaxID=112874 RepID=UPI00281575AC|nr:uncharacterized protein LOC132066403 [Lycium ferocissimum]